MNRRSGTVVCLLLLIALGGCAHNADQSAFRLPWEEIPERIPGVKTPRERIEELEALPAVTGAEAAQRAETLAQEIQREQDPLVRMHIIRALARVPDAKAAAVLHAGLEDPSEMVRIACCEAWGTRGGPDAVNELATVLQAESSLDVRMAAARALGETRNAAAVQPLATALTDNDPAMQRRVMESLKHVSGKDYGYDVQAWRQYANGETPQPANVSIAERLRRLF